MEPERVRASRLRLAGIPALLLLVASLALAQDAAEPPRRLGLTEESGVTLLLLDVECVDKDGKPLRGLTRKDFSIRLGGKRWKIYSVDDLCPCGDHALPPASAGPSRTEGGREVAGVPDREVSGQEAATSSRESEAGDAVRPGVDAETFPSAPGESAAGALPARGEEVHFVLYIDFSQLRIGSRRRAVQGAERWVRETMKDGEKAMLVAYSTATGLRQVTNLTGSREALIEALETTYHDRAFIDSFPDEFVTRIDECREDPPKCPIYAMQEYFHGRAALRAMKRLMTSIEELPGRKAVIYFHENGMMLPGKPYLVRSRSQLDLTEEVAAAANQAQASIYTVNAETEPIYNPLDPVWDFREEQALTLGSNLADFTGGGYNHGAYDMSRFLDATERRCKCLYRLGLVPGEAKEGRIYRARVVAAGREMPAEYRVQFLSDADRWVRKARNVLESPGRARDLPVTAGIIPVEAEGRRWTVAVEVAVPAEALVLLRGAQGGAGEWETGALIHREDGSEATEMLGIYSVRHVESSDAGTVLLHRQTLDGLPPGEYRLRAFVRDRTAGLFGGAEAHLVLPSPRKGGVTGPVWLLAGQPSIVSPLPILGEAPERDSSSGPAGEAWVPGGEFPVLERGALEAHTWICPGKGSAHAYKPVRFVSREAEPLVRFPEAQPAPAGTCREVTDRVLPGQLETGAYLYHLLLGGEDGDLALERPFRIP